MDGIERLHKAALQGDLAALHRLLQEDPLLLNRIESTSAAAGNPLHTASLRGDVGFAAELLKLRPQLAEMREEGGSYPIHLAAAGGHVGVLTQILGTKNPDLWRVRDKDGRTALHLAAANGRVEVVRELLKVDPELVELVSIRGETALHMCLRKNQVEAAELLVGCKAELVNVKDSEGNTALHLATARKQLQMLELFLSKTREDVNATNECDCTALDILSQGPSDYGDMEIRHLLSNAGSNRNRKAQQNSNPTNAQKKRWMPLRWSRRKKKEKNWYQEKHNTLLIVATLIATVTFAAGLSPPRGVWQESKDLNGSPSSSPSQNKCSPESIVAGTAILNDCPPEIFKFFMYFDLSGLVTSLFIILFLVSGLPLKNHLTTWILVITMWIAVTSVIMAFICGAVLVVNLNMEIVIPLLVILAVWAAFMVILLVWHLMVLIFRLILLIFHLIFWIFRLILLIFHLIFWIFRRIHVPKFLKSTRLSSWMKKKFQRTREKDTVQV